MHGMAHAAPTEQKAAGCFAGVVCIIAWRAFEPIATSPRIRDKPWERLASPYTHSLPPALSTCFSLFASCQVSYLWWPGPPDDRCVMGRHENAGVCAF